MDENISYILDFAKRAFMSVDDLIREAELVEEYGEYFHMSLMGFSPEQLYQAAKEMAA